MFSGPEGALAFLRRRTDVDDDRIGGLGLSTGANTLIEVAAQRRELKAVVAEGATARSFADYRNLSGIDRERPDENERRVVRFFDEALLERAGS